MIRHIWLILNSIPGNDKSFQLIPPHSIASIDGDLPVVLDDQADFSSFEYVFCCDTLQTLFLNNHFSPQKLEKKEQHALEQAERQMASINLNVSGEVQALFDRLSFMYCHWFYSLNIEYLVVTCRMCVCLLASRVDGRATV